MKEVTYEDWIKNPVPLDKPVYAIHLTNVVEII